jgi:hypothetical protein
MTDKQLARLNETTALSKVEDFNDWYDQMKDAAFIVSPLTHLDSIAPIYQISRRIVKLDPDPSGTDVYQSKLFHKEGEVSPSKVGLLKIMAAAGASMKSAVRTDDGQHPYVVEFNVTIKARDFDGMWREFSGTKRLDLRDKSPDAVSMTDRELPQARKNIVPLCETKALERAIRGYFQLPHKYKQKELQAKPFICPVLVLNAEHPAVQTRMIESHLSGGSTDKLFGETRELKQVEGARLPAAKEQEALPQAKPEPEDLGDDLPEVKDEDDVIIVCGCPCGHGREISEETAKATMDQYGAARCGQCVPKKSWDVAMHESTKKLNLPKLPALTADMVTARLKAAK